MNIIDAIQGSPQWLSVRATPNTFTASEAPAMMGASKYQTRTELLHQKHTGLAAEVDSNTQRLFDRGHAAEAAARPIVEEFINDALFPVTGTIEIDGITLLASFDGLTMMEDIAWETKLWNARLADAVRAGQIEPHYYWQLEQQLLVAGAERVYFTTSDGTPENTVGMWYVSDSLRRAQLIAGWKQFAIDLAAYVPPEVIPAAVATPTLDFPIPSIELGGSIALKSNLTSFGEQLKAYIAALPAKPSTDQEFVDCKAALSKLKEAELALDSEEARALAQLAEIDEMRREKNLYFDLARTTRLSLEKLVTAQEAAIKGEILADARHEFTLHIAALEAEIEPIRLVCKQPDFAGAMKNKRTLASLQNAVNTELAAAKIEADAAAKDIRAKLAWVAKHADAHRFLLNDMQQIIQKPFDDFTLLVNSRIDAHKKAEAEKIEAAKAAEAERIAAAVEAERKAGEARAAAAMEAQRKEAEFLAAEAVQKQAAQDQRGKAEPVGIASPALASTPPTPEAKRAAVVEAQDDISLFLASLEVSDKVKQTVRAYLVEFIKFTASRREVPESIAA